MHNEIQLDLFFLSMGHRMNFVLTPANTSPVTRVVHVLINKTKDQRIWPCVCGSASEVSCALFVQRPCMAY